MESGATYFFEHEFGMDQRSSTPKSGRHSGRAALFHSNESSIMEAEFSATYGDRSKLKRRLFDNDGPGFSAALKTAKIASAPVRVETQTAPPSTPSVTAASYATGALVIEDPENQSWTVHQRNAFFEAVKECGSDCTRIALRMKALLGASLGSRARSRSVTDVQKYLQHVVKVVSEIMEMKGRRDEAFVRYALVNFGEWTRLNPDKKMPVNGGRSDVRSLLLKELILTGEAMFPTYHKTASGVKAKTSVRIRTPNAPTLRQLHLSDDAKELPSAIHIRLRPRTAVTLRNVMRSGQPPIISIKLNPASTLKYLFDCLRKHWQFERTEKKYLNAEAPELTLRPPAGSVLHWPPVMPDFRVLLHRNKLCWLAYERFAKRFPTKDTLTPPIKDELLAADSPVLNENILCNEDAVFYSNIESDDDEDSNDATVVDMETSDKAVVKGFDPKMQYPEFFDEQGNVVWSSAKHLYLPLPEIYMIAGSDGQVTLDYDWIIPDEDLLDFKAKLFHRENICLRFWQTLQLSPPPALLQESSRTTQKRSMSPQKRSSRQQEPVAQWQSSDLLAEDVSNSHPVPSSASTTPAAVHVPIDHREKGVVVESGGDALSEFIVPAAQQTAATTVGQSHTSLTESSVITMDMLNQITLATGQQQLFYLDGQLVALVPSHVINPTGSTAGGQFGQACQQPSSPSTLPLQMQGRNATWSASNSQPYTSPHSPQTLMLDGQAVHFVNYNSSPSTSGGAVQPTLNYAPRLTPSADVGRKALGRPSKASRMPKNAPKRTQNLSSLLPKSSSVVVSHALWNSQQ